MGAAGRKHWSELRGAPGRHQCAEDQAFGTVRTRHSGSNWAARTLVWDIQGCGKRTGVEVATHSEDKLMGSDIILPALPPPPLTP
ncbi:hypothetical protein E5288_WYG019602 [Bos mutus]|uniref:Uncharacterized protein n=1 Tax=Bos mutus TaxID=72004 RepID=A0A6B0RV54_9CETA|nr:hypothetical protein [Bos mutus]